MPRPRTFSPQSLHWWVLLCGLAALVAPVGAGASFALQIYTLMFASVAVFVVERGSPRVLVIVVIVVIVAMIGLRFAAAMAAMQLYRDFSDSAVVVP
jgi:hypothetical protein